MISKQQELPLPHWGGARKGAGRKRKGPRRNVPHRTRSRFTRGALHVTVRVRREVWNLRTHRCFRALRRAFERGCARFGFRLVHFSVQGNHIHFIVEAPDQLALTRAMKGLEVRMARALNKVMDRKGPVFSDRYHAHLLKAPSEARYAWDYVLSNWRIHAAREGRFVPRGADPYSSAADPAGTMRPEFWMLRAGIWRRKRAPSYSSQSWAPSGSSDPSTAAP
jgi:putative transposase